jgi:Domain of unknown function (DUF397)
MKGTSSGVVAASITASWVKSSFSGPQGNCVEVARVDDGAVAVRNSRYPAGPALVFTPAEWDAFLAGARAGEFGAPPDRAGEFGAPA